MLEVRGLIDDQQSCDVNTKDSEPIRRRVCSETPFLLIASTIERCTSLGPLNLTYCTHKIPLKCCPKARFSVSARDMHYKQSVFVLLGNSPN